MDSSEDVRGSETGSGLVSIPVKLPVYEGPLDLLLDLIKKNEMNIYDIEINIITQQYLDCLKEMKRLDLEIAGEFIVMAATLIYIKSKMLLPDDGLDEEDEEEGDPRAELVRKLLEYQAFKEAAKRLGLLEDERSRVFTHQVADYYLAQVADESLADGADIDTFSANLFDLLQAFHKVMQSISREAFHEVFTVTITIEEKIAELKELLQIKKEIVFTDLFKPPFTRNTLIVTFMALLEVVRTKYATVLQQGAFGEIILKQRTNFTDAGSQNA